MHGSTESYKFQMEGHARVRSVRGNITDLNPQTLISITHQDQTGFTHKINRRHYIQNFVAAAKLGHSMGQILKAELAIGWFIRFPPTEHRPRKLAVLPLQRILRTPSSSNSDRGHGAEEGRHFSRRRKSPTLYPLDTVKEEMRM